MKNLKKLSVVLFATLLSFNFTSCIDDGVSEAVDQVYLAQAEFLKAQAALQEAKAVLEMANATREEAEASLLLAKAEVELAYARETDAYTQDVLADVDAQLELNAFNAQKNIMALEELKAKLDVTVQLELTKLAQAQSAHDVAVVNLGVAVQEAKDNLLLGYYVDYVVVIDELEDLYEEKIEAETDLALKELLIKDLTAMDMVTLAYFQAGIEADLAKKEGQLAAEIAKLAKLEAITADDASDYEKAVTDLEADIAVLEEQKEALVLEHAEALNAVDQAMEAWEASAAQYQELTDAQNLLKLAVDAKKEHTDAIADAEDAIEDADANIAAIPAAEAALAAVDTTAAYNAIQDQIALIGTKDSNNGATTNGKNNYANVAWPDSDAFVSTGTSLYDIQWNLEIAESIAEDVRDEAVAKKAEASGLIAFGGAAIQNLEWDLANKKAILDGFVPPIAPISDLEDDVADTDAAEAVAQANFDADPAGLTIDPGTDMIAGENQATTGETWVQVTAFGLTGPTFGTTTYDSFASVQLGEDVVDDPLTPLVDETVTSVAVVVAYAAIDGTMVGHWYNVEADDSSVTNYIALQNARFDAWNAQSALDFANGALTVVQEDYDDALEALTKAYACFGYVYGSGGIYTMGLNDYQAALDYVANELTDAVNDAQDDVDDAETAESAAAVNITKAITKLGVDFRPMADTNEFTDLWYQWWNLNGTDALVTSYSAFVNYSAEYQRLEGPISLTKTGRIYDLPHTGNNVTLYQDLRNAYFQVVWAKEALAALQNVTYDSYLKGNNWTSTNAKVKTQAGKDIAALEALLPSHDFAIDYLLSEVDRLAAEFNIDTTNWDFEGGHGLGGMLLDLPAYANYLDALVVSNAVLAQFTSVNTQISDIENIIAAYAYLQSGNFTDPSENVKAFLAANKSKITTAKGNIVTYTDDVEHMTNAVSEGIVDIATAEAWIEECKRQLVVLEGVIVRTETAAATLLARIDALLN